MDPQCKLHMLWNTQIIDTCVVFPSWHIRSTSSFFFSCLVIVALGVFYEYLREFQKKYDHHLALSLNAKGKAKLRISSGRNTPEQLDQEASGQNALLGSDLWRVAAGAPVPPVPRAVRALIYGACVFLSFFLMLVFMTYNAYLIFAVVLGAAIGHYVFGSTMNIDAALSNSNGKGMACH